MFIEWLSLDWHLPVILLTAVLFYLSSPARFQFCSEHFRHRSQQSIQLSIECEAIEELYSKGRNLLNKKEAGPPSTIKESSESSQTIDDNESEKGSGQLKHENTVVRADGGGVVAVKTSIPNSNAAAHPALRNDIVRVTQLLVDSIANKDFTTYSRLCDPAVTFIGPETGGQIVEGVEFHRYQFEQHSMNSSGSSSSGRVQSTMLQAHVHAMGEDGASIAYILLTQFTDRDAQPRTRQSQESRVWHKKNGRWVCVHAHRSGGPEAL